MDINMRYINIKFFNKKPLLMRSSINNIYMNEANIFTGLDIGIPLNIFSNKLPNS